MSNVFTYTSGWLKGKNGTTGDYKFTCTIDLNSQSVADNTSNITCTMTMFCNNNGSTLWNATAASNQPYAELTGDVSAMGEGIRTYKKSTTPLTVITWTGNIEHDADGSKTLEVDFNWVAGALEWYPATQTITSSSVALPTIARGVSISFNGGTIADTSTPLTVGITAQNGLTGSLSGDIGGATFSIWSGTIPAGGTELIGIDPEDILDRMPSSASDTLVLTLTVSSPFAGTITKSGTVVVDTNQIKPSTGIDSIVPAFGNPITGVFVAGYSMADVRYTTGLSTGCVSLVNTFKTNHGEVSPTTSTTVGTGLFSGTLPESVSDYVVRYRISTVDLRGATATDVDTITVKGYKPPVITVDAYRCNSSGTKESAGAYVKCDFSATYMLTAEGNVGSVSATMNGNAYTSGTVTSLPAGSTATFVITATDKVTSVSTTKKVGVAIFPLDLYDDGNGNIGVGLAGAFASAGFVGLGNSSIDEVSMINGLFRFLNTGAMVNFISGNSTNADNLLPEDENGDIIAGAVSLAFATSNSGRTNWPSTGQRGVILSIALSAGAGTYAVQFAYMNATTVLYMRYKSTSWQAWRSVTFS